MVAITRQAVRGKAQRHRAMQPAMALRQATQPTIQQPATPAQPLPEQPGQSAEVLQRRHCTDRHQRALLLALFSQLTHGRQPTPDEPGWVVSLTPNTNNRISTGCAGMPGNRRWQACSARIPFSPSACQLTGRRKPWARHAASCAANASECRATPTPATGDSPSTSKRRGSPPSPSAKPCGSPLATGRRKARRRVNQANGSNSGANSRLHSHQAASPRLTARPAPFGPRVRPWHAPTPRIHLAPG